MGFRMPKVNTQGPRGTAKIAIGKLNDKKYAEVVFADKHGNYSEYCDKYMIPVTRDTVPRYLQSGIFYVQLSKDTRKIERMSPQEGQFKGKVTDFARRENEPPVPQTNTKAKWPYEYFTPIIEIVEPDRYKGMTVATQIHYRFEPAMVEWKGKKVQAAGIPVSKSKTVEVLDNFILATRASNIGPIPYSDNVLPDLLKRVMREEAVFDFIMKDGWVNNFLPPDLNEVFADESDIEFDAEEPKDAADFGEPDETPEFVENSGEFTPDESEEEVAEFEDDADSSPAPWDDVED